MASLIDSSSAKEVCLSSARAFLFVFDHRKEQWLSFGERGFYKLQLFVREGNYQLVGTNETFSGQKPFKVPLVSSSTYRSIDETFYQLRTIASRDVTTEQLYGLKFSSVQDARFFSVVLESTLSSVAGCGKPTPPPSASSSLSSGTGSIGYHSLSENSAPSSWASGAPSSLPGNRGSPSGTQVRSTHRHSSLGSVRPPEQGQGQSRRFAGPASLKGQSSAVHSSRGEEDRRAMEQGTSKLSHIQLAQLVGTLSEAIGSGDKARASTIAEMLATERALVQVQARGQASTEPKAYSEEISVIVQVEDRDKSGPELNVKVSPTITVLELKTLFWKDYKFPIEVQRWIIDKKFMKDEQTLEYYGIEVPNTRVFLYLVSAKHAQLPPRDVYHRQKENEGQKERLPAQGPPAPRGGVQLPAFRPTDNPIHQPVNHLPPNIEPSGGGANSFQNSRQARGPSSFPQRDAEPFIPPAARSPIYEHQEPGLRATRSKGSFLWQPPGAPKPEPMYPPPANTHADARPPRAHATPLPSRNPQRQSSGELPVNGWACKECTLINEPTRPGCAVCSSPRPVDYVVPNDAPISETERRRLAAEAELEKLVIEGEQGGLFNLGSPSP